MTCKVCFVRIGSTPIELIEHIEGESLHADFLEEHGDGINHIGFVVEDLAKETENLVSKGYPVVVSLKHKGAPGGVAYFDTRKDFGGLFLELLENPQSGNVED